MSVTNSESSDINNPLSVSDSNESINTLLRSLCLSRCELERELVELINDCDIRNFAQFDGGGC